MDNNPTERDDILVKELKENGYIVMDESSQFTEKQMLFLGQYMRSKTKGVAK